MFGLLSPGIYGDTFNHKCFFLTEANQNQTRFCVAGRGGVAVARFSGGSVLRQACKTATIHVCAESNHYVIVGKQDYVVNASDGNLMPVRKDEPPPDLRYFVQPPK
jgi:hypothetical protein